MVESDLVLIIYLIIWNRFWVNIFCKAVIKHIQFIQRYDRLNIEHLLSLTIPFL